MKTDLKDKVWNGTVAIILQKTKLLITDYSSVCYNAFYQGAGVVFYQPNLKKYEKNNGKLIPNEEEYIGIRVFEPNELEKILQQGIKNQKIQLEFFRTMEFEKRYEQINEFCDGKNISRIVDFLKNKEII